MAQHQDLSISLTPEGEAHINFPDGLHISTGLFPDADDEEAARRFFSSTFGRTLIMQLRTREIHDGLTSLLLQAPARALIRKNIERLNAVRFNGIVSVLLLDLDHFGQVNKQYGQNAGDQALRWFASILGQSVRTNDIIARWGGEEFLVFATASTPAPEHAHRDRDTMPHSDTASSSQEQTLSNLDQLMGNGKLIGERIRSATQNARCHVGNADITQTVTVGVANAYIKHNSDLTGLFETLLKNANDVMYQGKREDKRNRVHVAPMIYGKQTLTF